MNRDDAIRRFLWGIRGIVRHGRSDKEVNFRRLMLEFQSEEECLMAHEALIFLMEDIERRREAMSELVRLTEEYGGYDIPTEEDSCE